MLDKDKVKINAYLDQELSELEINEVEKLLKEDGEAKEYFERLKKVNLELEAFASNNAHQELHNRTESFLEKEIKPQLQKNSNGIFAFLQNNIFQHVAGYSMTAALFFGIGTNLLEQPQVLNLEQPQVLNLDDFNASQTLTKEYPKFRNESFDTQRSKLEDTLNEMVTSRFLNSRLIWGGDTYFITIEELVLSKDDTECFQGHFLNEGVRQELLYCISENDATLTYIN